MTCLNHYHRCSKNPLSAEEKVGVRAAKGKKYKEMWSSSYLSNDGFSSWSEYAKTINAKVADVRLKTNIEGEGDMGGYLVPEEFRADILDVALENEVVRPRATVYPMKSEFLKIPGLRLESCNFNSRWSDFTMGRRERTNF